jgi:Dephospho-CoA kinase
LKRPLAVAITGGIGAGKSEALRAFERHGAAVISSDEIVHRLLQEDEGVRVAIKDRFGDRALDDAGRIAPRSPRSSSPTGTRSPGSKSSCIRWSSASTSPGARRSGGAMIRRRCA